VVILYRISRLGRYQFVLGGGCREQADGIVAEVVPVLWRSAVSAPVRVAARSMPGSGSPVAGMAFTIVGTPEAATPDPGSSTIVTAASTAPNGPLRFPGQWCDGSVPPIPSPMSGASAPDTQPPPLSLPPRRRLPTPDAELSRGFLHPSRGTAVAVASVPPGSHRFFER